MVGTIAGITKNPFAASANCVCLTANRRQRKMILSAYISIYREDSLCLKKKVYLYISAYCASPLPPCCSAPIISFLGMCSRTIRCSRWPLHRRPAARSVPTRMTVWLCSASTRSRARRAEQTPFYSPLSTEKKMPSSCVRLHAIPKQKSRITAHTNSMPLSHTAAETSCFKPSTKILICM